MPFAILAGTALAWQRWAGSFRVIARTPLAPVLPGDRLVIERWDDRGRPFARGDLVVRAGSGLARVVALPGERLRVVNGVVSLDGRTLPHWRVANAGPACADDAGPSCSRMRIAIRFKNGALVLPPLPDGDHRLSGATLLVLSATGRLVPTPLGQVAGRAGPVWLSLTSRFDLRRPWAWPGAIRWSRIGLPLGDHRPIG